VIKSVSVNTDSHKKEAAFLSCFYDTSVMDEGHNEIKDAISVLCFS